MVDIQWLYPSCKRVSYVGTSRWKLTRYFRLREYTDNLDIYYLCSDGKFYMQTVIVFYMQTVIVFYMQTVIVFYMNRL